MYNQQRSKYESKSRSRMAQAWRTNQNGRRGNPARAAYVRIHNRTYLCTGRSDGGQVSGPFQRPGASASRTCSSLEQPQKHAACRPGENNLLEIITLLAPSWGHATRHRSEATSYKLQAEATSNKRQAASYKLQAASYKRLR